jgi:hypothetical protein
MRTRLFAVAFALGVLLAAVWPSTLSAAPMEDVTIRLHPSQFFPVQIGTWEAEGAITDSGTYERTEGATSPPERPFGQPGPFRETFVLTSTEEATAGSTLTIRDESRDTGSEVTGVWQIASGTGVYERARGHGTLSFSAAPPLFTLTLTGVMSEVE